MTTLDELSQRLSETQPLISGLMLDIDKAIPEMSIEQAYELKSWIDEFRNVLSVLGKAVDAHMTTLVPKDKKELVWQYGNRTYRTEVRFSAVRTQIAKDDLLKAVKASARVLDESTGEVTVDNNRLIEIIEKSYRFEPRWTEIKGLGIDPDEFCSTKYEAKVSTSIIDTEQEQ
jgi:hypothetical protein